MNGFFIIAILISIGILAYQQASLLRWTVTLGVLLVVSSYFISFSILLIFAWLAWAGLAAFSYPDLRRHFFSRPLLNWYRRLLPPLSRTEKEALEAGNTWWDAELFSGRPDWQVLLSQPVPRLSAEEQSFLQNETETLCKMLDDWQITHQLKDLPPEVWQYIKQQRFFGMIIPKRYGGLGFSVQAHSAVITKIGTRSASAAVTVMVPNSLGPAELLLQYGTEAQKNYYLPRLAIGEEIPCFALTSPNAGSDAASIPDFGIVCYGEYQGQQVLGMKVTWDKRYITLAPVATLLGLAFHLYDPEHLLGEQEDIGISLALIPTTHSGVNIGRRHYPARQAFQNGPTWGKEVFIPLTMLIGGQKTAGQGWKMLMNCLATGRAISLPAMATGAALYSARFSGDYARIRKQFKTSIGQFEGIQEALARLAANAYELEAARRVTAAALDSGKAPSVISAILKYRATEAMRRSLSDAMDIHGGRAICDGARNYLLHGYQSVPIAITVEGANILTRSLIVFGQGAIRCHPYLLKEIHAAEQQDLAAFDHALTSHVGFLFSNLVHCAVHNLTAGYFLEPPLNAAPAMHGWYQQLHRYSLNFATLADITLLLLGGKLKTKEMLSGRFADIFSELYLLSCCLKRFELEGHPTEDEVLIQFLFNQGLSKIQQKFAEILANYPVPWLAWGLRHLLIKPNKTAACDCLTQRVAAILLSPSPTRERLTQGMFVNTDPQDISGRLEHAFNLVVATDELDRKLQKVIKAKHLFDKPHFNTAEIYQFVLSEGLLSPDEIKRLQITEEAVNRAIAVDDFAPDELKLVMAKNCH